MGAGQEHAGFHWHDLIASGLVKAKLKAAGGIAPGNEFDLVAVAICVWGLDERSDALIRVGNAADAGEGIDDGASLGDRLSLAADMLPRAAAAHSEVRAGRLDAVRGSFDDMLDSSSDEAPVVLSDLEQHSVSGTRAGDERSPPVIEMRDAISAVGEAFYLRFRHMDS
jgi:hypothetical protein